MGMVCQVHNSFISYPVVVVVEKIRLEFTLETSCDLKLKKDLDLYSIQKRESRLMYIHCVVEVKVLLFSRASN